MAQVMMSSSLSVSVAPTWSKHVSARIPYVRARAMGVTRGTMRHVAASRPAAPLSQRARAVKRIAAAADGASVPEPASEPESEPKPVPVPEAEAAASGWVWEGAKPVPLVASVAVGLILRYAVPGEDHVGQEGAFFAFAGSLGLFEWFKECVGV